MLEDYEKDIDERDLTHAPEILVEKDKRLDPRKIDFRTAIEEAINNYDYRAFHHHTFLPSSMIRLMDEVGFRILHVDVLLTSNIIVVVKKLDINEHRAEIHRINRGFLDMNAQWRSNSPFKIDKS